LLNKNEESAWQKASASLDVSAKVYGYRVDSVHSETFKFLGGLNRNKKEEEVKEGDQEEEKENEEVKKEIKIRRGQNTLETNINKLNLTKYDLETEVDPLFSIMTSKFNESSASGLLLNTIPLDEKMNYILESKEKADDEQDKNKNKNNNKKEEKKANESEEIKDIDLLSEDSSNDHLGHKKIPEQLINDEDSELNKKKNNITCAENMDLIPEDIKNIINNFSTENQIDDFTQLKICPDLAIFRKTRDLKSSENNDIFLKYFKDEINHAERLKPSEFNEPEGIIEEPEDIENQFDEGHMENAPDGSSQNENGIDPNDIKDIEEPSQENVNLNNFTNVSLSLFKYDDLIEHSEKFGGGNIDVLKNLPQYNNFAKAFGKVENKGFFNKILGIKKQAGKKKKEEILFEFNEEKEVDINKLLTEPKSKTMPKSYDFTNDFENKKKLKCFYHFDKLSTFRLYTMNNRTIFSREIEGDINVEDQEKKILDKIEEDDGLGLGDAGDNNDFNGFDGEPSAGNDLSGRNNTFYNNEKEIEKNFGRLYRRFDIRTLKNKIWNNYENFFPNDNIDFKQVVSNMSKDMSEEELYSISTPTCFVCMLHLCNENNLYINQKDINTFYIEKDSNGEKSALSSKTKSNDITKPKNKKSKKNKNNDDDMAIDE
jgi:hypothetical protein